MIERIRREPMKPLCPKFLRLPILTACTIQRDLPRSGIAWSATTLPALMGDPFNLSQTSGKFSFSPLDRAL
jgi:hypothetical protein